MAKKKKKSNKFNYSQYKGGTSKNAHKQQTQGSQYGYLSLPKGVNVFKETPGSKNVQIDFLPYIVKDEKHPDRDDDENIAVPGNPWYKRPFRIHRNIGSEGETVVCLTSFGHKCPICEYRADQLNNQGASYQDQAMKDLKPKPRNLYVVVPLNTKDYEAKPHVWDIAQGNFQDALNEELEEDEDLGTFWAPTEEGATLKLRFSSEKISTTTFAKISRIDFIDREENYDEEIVNETPCLDELLAAMSYKELKRKFMDVPEEIEEEEEDEDEEPDEEEDEDDEEEEEEKPAKSGKKKSGGKKKKDEDEDEDEDDQIPYDYDEDEGEEEDEDEEEEDQPAKGKKSGKGSGSSKKKSSGKGKNKCPYGHKFGEDCEEYEDCDECEVFSDCLDASEG